ncbi:hypothetical protein LCGC14_2139010, partial [marine sediment metagenome]
EFEFSVGDALIKEWTNLLLRFYKDQAIVNQGVGTEDISGLNNVIAHWLLNDAAGTTVLDDDGATHNGTASIDTSTLTTTGKVNAGFDLDGQYDVEISDHDDFSFTDNSNDTAFSIACWGRVTNQGGLQVLLSKWRDAATIQEWRFSLTNDRKLQLHLSDSSSNLEADRISQWKLNEDAANTSVVDAVGLQNGVSTVNTSTLAATGQLSGAFDMDTQYAVEVNDNAAYSFGDAVNDSAMSIVGWIFFDNLTSQQTILSKMDENIGSEAREWIFWVGARTLNFSAFDESADTGKGKTLTGTVTAGWHFVAITYSGVGGVSAFDGMTLYVDAVAPPQQDTTRGVGTYVAMENTTTKVVIGAKYGTAGTLDQYWGDKLDNIILFDIELNQAQISAMWNDGNGIETTVVSEVSAVSDSALTTGWHFLSSTYSAPADESTAAAGIILYVDSAAVASTNTENASYTAMQNGAEEVRIGSQRNAGDTANENFWEDKIDEISIYGDVLTPTEVASLYSTTPYSIISPYTTAQAFAIHYTQSADVMYIAHNDVHPKKLSRLDTLDWTIVDVPFTGGPFLTENTTAASLIGFARLGGTARSGYYFPADATGTLTASGTDNEPFNTNMVGGIWLIKHTRPDNTTSTQDNDTNVAPTTLTNAVLTKGDFT